VDIKAGVKYCGGCNPNYDRKETAASISRQTGIRLETYSEEQPPDIALIICGCTSECVKTDKYKGRYETIVVNSPEQLWQAVERIRQYTVNLPAGQNK